MGVLVRLLPLPAWASCRLNPVLTAALCKQGAAGRMAKTNPFDLLLKPRHVHACSFCPLDIADKRWPDAAATSECTAGRLI